MQLKVVIDSTDTPAHTSKTLKRYLEQAHYMAAGEDRTVASKRPFPPSSLPYPTLKDQVCAVQRESDCQIFDPKPPRYHGDWLLKILAAGKFYSYGR